LLLFLAPTKKNPHRILAILLDGTYPWYLTKDSNISNAAQEIFMHFVLSKFNITLKDLTNYLISSQNNFYYITLSKRKTLSAFSFIVSSKYPTSSGNTNTLILTRNQITKVKVTEFYNSKPLSVNNDGAVLITKYGFNAIEVLDFIDLFNKMV
jgi:hypothetical protein